MGRIKANLVASALMRQAEILGLSTYLVKKGDRDYGTIYIRQNLDSHNACLFERMHDLDGLPKWRKIQITETVDHMSNPLDLWLQNRQNSDPDLWIIDIDDPQKTFIFDAPIVDF